MAWNQRFVGEVAANEQDVHGRLYPELKHKLGNLKKIDC
jgi:hypothetical protein